eukprot:TRINITY_DN23393_c0_g1_i1.p1 TRINITY_DN23393_c0_g1~~TRINITY_DN23393_c0_g1_i1.p1  ORF type:complete len:171 (+),score=26.42 TRINITY_DN23393_c0_g1_i1:349-861(+)
MDALQALSSDSGSDSEQEEDASPPTKRPNTVKPKVSVDAVMRAGYESGPSILHIPEQRDAVPECSFQWSKGSKGPTEEQDTQEERAATREAVGDAVKSDAAHAQRAQQFTQRLRDEKVRDKQEKAQQKKLSFKEKEKRKRDAGMQASSKNYVEEEKRIARELGFYSGFDT